MYSRRVLVTVVALSILVGVGVGFTACAFALRWEWLCRDFFSFTLADLIKTLVGVAMGSIVLLYLNQRNLKSAKSLELAFSMLHDFEECLETVYEEGKAFMAQPDRGTETKINGMLKTLSNRLALLSEFKGNKALNSKALAGLKERYWELKECLTGGNFGQKAHKYDETKRLFFESRYELLKTATTQLRISLLS